MARPSSLSLHYDNIWHCREYMYKEKGQIILYAAVFKVIVHATLQMDLITITTVDVPPDQ